MTRLAILTSHAVQYYSPLFRELAKSLDLKVFFAHRATPEDQARAGFGKTFEWDVDLTEGFEHAFLANISIRPGTDHYGGCDTPEIAMRLQDGRFDALLMTGWQLKSFAQGLRAAKRLKLPIIVRGDSHLETPRNLVKRMAKEIAYPLFLRQFDAACFVGKRSRAYYRHYHYPERRLFSSPHCVDSTWFGERATAEARATLRQQHGIPQEARLVLFAGKLVPFKRPLDLVPALVKLRENGLDARLLVAGSGELEEALRFRAVEFDLPLYLLGFLNQSEMPAAYAAADVLALPSDARETWGLVCNEALACGTPIVISDQVGCAPDLADGAVGLSYAMGDTAACAQSVQRLLTSPPTRSAIASLSSDFNLQAGAGGIREAFDILCEMGKARRSH